MSSIVTWREIEPILRGIDLLEEMSLGFQAYSSGRCVVPPVGELLLDQSQGEVHTLIWESSSSYTLIHWTSNDIGPVVLPQVIRHQLNFLLRADRFLGEVKILEIMEYWQSSLRLDV